MEGIEVSWRALSLAFMCSAFASKQCCSATLFLRICFRVRN